MGRAYFRTSLGEAKPHWIGGFKGLPEVPPLIGDRLKDLQEYDPRGRRYQAGPLLERAVMAAAPPAAAPRRDMQSEEKAQAAPKDELKAEEPQKAAPPSEAPVQLRSDFAETAFWLPHLIADQDGSVSFEFQVPDSITSWKVWVHALTHDLRSGSTQRETKSVKDLMVRPYLPRFLREGDRAKIKVVVNNASDRQMIGKLTLDIFDPETNQSLLSAFGLPAGARNFEVAVGSGTNLTFAIATPAKVGTIAFKVVAQAGDISDGELRLLPVLPGRMHLMQSRFVSLKDKGSRTMIFEDLQRDDDPTRVHEQLVITLDAQLFYSVLSALPYLIQYPYECTEQTLNRFLSTGILSSLYSRYPAIERAAEQFSKRKTQYDTWEQTDPNRKMALEETPWLQMAKGGPVAEDQLFNVLDPQNTRTQREEALDRLHKAQTSSGGFPWFPGGPPSPFMTLYLLHGFSKGAEFGVDVPNAMVQRAWEYMHRHFIDEMIKDMRKRDCCWETVTFLNYVLSNNPNGSWSKEIFSEKERKTMADFSFTHWKKHSPYLKGYLALTLKRMGRNQEAKLVWESVMDAAKTAEDQGAFWTPEDRSWLWYNDHIETHAFALRTAMELTPQDPKISGLILWLFINKKLNHWKSTRATAEVLYAIAHYLKATGQMAVRETATARVGQQKREFVFEPDQYTGKKSQILIPGEKIDPKTASAITVEKETPGFLLASATWHFSTEKMPEEERGEYMNISRSFYKRSYRGKEMVLEPLKEGGRLHVGDEVEVQISLRAKHSMEYVHLRDPRGAGFEPVAPVSRHKWDLGLCWYEEIRDSGTNFFFEYLPQGEYSFRYRTRAATAGTFKVSPATVQPMYAPEFAAYSSGAMIVISGDIK